MSPLITHDAVPVDPFRDRFLLGASRGEFNASDIAERLGWLKRDGTGDSTRVLRAIGVRPETARRGGKPHLRKHMRYELATRMCRALGVDPVDVDV